MKAPITPTQAWAVIAESAGGNAKELPVLPDLDTWSAGICIRNDVCQQRMKAYGAACAAHARKLALEEAIQAIRALWHGDGDGERKCIYAIEAIKGK